MFRLLFSALFFVILGIFFLFYFNFCFLFWNLVTKYYGWAYKRVDPFSRLIATLLFVFPSQNKKKSCWNWTEQRETRRNVLRATRLSSLPDMKLKKKKKRKKFWIWNSWCWACRLWIGYQQSHTFYYLIFFFFFKKINTILSVSLCLRVRCAFFVFRNIFKRGGWNDTISK